jgi:hypothetical protein
MSVDLEVQLHADRALRDSARALIEADIDHIRADLASRGVGERIFDRIGEGAVDVFEEAVEVADNNRGVLATLLAAVVLWFARHPLLSLLTDDDGDDDEESGATEQGRQDGR